VTTTKNLGIPMSKKRVENRNFAKLPRKVPSLAMILELKV